ncbi:Protein PsbN [Platanthera zijinensis]
METATLVAISISGLLVSFTGYALYTAFGQPSQKLRDPFEEHGDYWNFRWFSKKDSEKYYP